MDHLKTSRCSVKLQHPVKVLYRQTNVIYSINICGGINQHSIGVKVKIYRHFVSLFIVIIITTPMIAIC